MTSHDTEEQTLYNIQVSYEKSCIKSLQKLSPDVSANFFDMTLKIMADSKTNGLHVEPIQGAQDASMRSIRMDRGMRAIGSLQGSTMVFLHVNTHDKAYRWARGRRVSLDPKTRRVRVVEAILETSPDQATEPGLKEAKPQDGLFDAVDNATLETLGLGDGEIARARRVVNEADLFALDGQIDATSHEILTALAMGYTPSDIPALISGEAEAPMPDTVEEFLHSDEGRATIFVPESEAELRRVLEGDLAGWRTFLHPEQRRLAYRDYNGPALVRGGAGTGKTVVAMHRAKHLADQIAADPARSEERVLFTTFTVNLARDIEANLKTLCPEHLSGSTRRIEVKNLDAWVGEFLKRRNFDRKVVYYVGDGDVQDIWQEVIETADIPEELTPEFLRNEWTQIVQAKGSRRRETTSKFPAPGAARLWTAGSGLGSGQFSRRSGRACGTPGLLNRMTLTGKPSPCLNTEETPYLTPRSCWMKRKTWVSRPSASLLPSRPAPRKPGTPYLWSETPTSGSTSARPRCRRAASMCAAGRVGCA